MLRFSIKNILLGVGIGIVLTSMMGMVYSAGADTRKLSDEEIIKQAEMLGMVKGTLTKPKDADQEKAASSPSPSKTATAAVDKKGQDTTIITSAATDAKAAPVPSAQTADVVVTINPGDTEIQVADKLFNAKVISDKKALIKMMNESGADKKIIAKGYTFKIGMELQDVIKKLISG